MIKKYVENFYDNPSMDFSWMKYKSYCSVQKEKRVYCMCRPIRDIQNMSAQQLIEHCGQENKIPVDLKLMLQKLKISCLPLDDSKVDERVLGALVTNGDKAVIFYRKKDVGGHRFRFTIAHELAHCCLQHYSITGKSVHFRLETDEQDEHEVAANIFAGELLIPEDSLREIIHRLVLPSLQVLADIFAVSINVMKARLDYLRISDNICGYNY